MQLRILRIESEDLGDEISATFPREKTERFK